MTNLEEYLFKNVRIVDTEDITHTGYIDSFTSASDNDEGEESIGIIPNMDSKEGVELFSSEIKSIEVVS